MLGSLLHVPRGPFYSPKVARSRWRPTRKAILAFCRVVHRTVRCAIAFQIGHRWPLQLQAHWCTEHCPVHTGQSGAPRRPLELPRVARRLCGRPLAQATVGSLDSPVHHRTVRWIIATSPLCFSRGRRVRPGWLTRQSSAPPDGPVNYSCTPSSSPESGLFTRTSLAHRTLSDVPSRAGVGCTEPSLFPILFSLFLALR
jgi:hypothetical protein